MTPSDSQETLRSDFEATDPKHTPFWAPPEWRDPSISQLTPDEGLLRGDIFSFCLMCYDLLTQRKDRPKEGSEADYSQIAINKLKEVQDFLLSQEKKKSEKNQSNKEVEKHDKEQDKDQLLKSSEDNQAEEEKKKEEEKRKRKEQEKRKQIKKTFGDHSREWIELLLEGLKNREESISWFVNQLSLLYED